MEEDQRLSEKIIQTADALKDWDGVKDLVDETTSLVNKYREVIDGVSSIFTVIGAVWDIYSSMEKAKEDAARQQDMVKQIIHAVEMIITSAKTEIIHNMDEIETRTAVAAAETVLEGFSHDFLPYVKINALTDKDMDKLDSLIKEARDAIVLLKNLIPVRANGGDGAALLKLYRDMLAVVQCKLTMDRLRHGLTHNVVTEAKFEVNRLLYILPVVNEGLWLVSDRCFSQGIVYFHVGGGGRPELTKYSYMYMGKTQPVHGPNMAPVSQAFIAARKAARDHAIPEEVLDWERQSVDIMGKLMELEKTVPA
ncbi:uncharacterized protein N7473_011221 [Penicillium subrubescens]|uniref:uncharacterized protein n=1 Tax=Penicillium subrubescens TaxID=1316194 RepID=UPI002544DF62|nr:uncharacterized protein N7473_011221 [Penicillium subrubescens]KAJ5880168.1 hypothetical protein N7473_011221 [Penicillium subrubescens]